MTATDSGVVRYTCTRIQLIDALAALPLGGYLTLEARGRFADCILGQLPEARGEAEIRADERDRIAGLFGEWIGSLTRIMQEPPPGEWCGAFADLIRGRS